MSDRFRLCGAVYGLLVAGDRVHLPAVLAGIAAGEPLLLVDWPG